MTKQKNITDEIIMNKILLIRKQKVMIDRDLGELYGVSTKQLNQQVKRNTKRFPPDFMFQLIEEEKNEVVTNCDHLATLKFSPVLPNVFTEHGAVMLASVLNSDIAIEVNIQIVRVFAKMRELLSIHKDILLHLEKIERRLSKHDEQILSIFEYIKRLIAQPKKEWVKISGFRKDQSNK